MRLFAVLGLLVGLLFPAASFARKTQPRTASPLFYSLDGSGNNLRNPTWGSAGEALLRRSPAAYPDGSSSPAGSSRPSARLISNLLSAQSEDVINDRGLSDFVYVFGQFLDHDIGLTTTGSESLPIAVPQGDPFFDPSSTGSKTISFKRSSFLASSSPRSQANSVTAWIDGSQVYGSDSTRAAALREFSGGRLKTSTGNMMPFNTAGLANANDAHVVPDDKLFLAGDVRANENVELIALHTLFLREHNRIAASLSVRNPSWSDEQLYQASRRLVIAELQAITYREFLPALLGRSSIKPYQGYRPGVSGQLNNEFSTGAFRFGHSLLDSEIQRLNSDGSPTPEGPISLRAAFFNSAAFDTSLPDHRGDIEPYLKGASAGAAQQVDLMLIDDVRNFLFGPPGSGGFDLAALNIQRGRDHGLPDYNTVRAAYGLPRIKSFSEVSSDPKVVSALSSTYPSVDDVDLWVGGLAESHAPGSSLGPLFTRMLSEQFTRLRDGDRIFYLRSLPPELRRQVSDVSLAKIVARNSSLTSLRGNVFFAAGTSTPSGAKPPASKPPVGSKGPAPSQSAPRPPKPPAGDRPPRR